MALDHERLIVYQRAIDFVGWTEAFIVELKLTGEIRTQLDRASISIPLNIAEGNGKFSVKDRIRFLDFAYGSSLECAACLDISRLKKAVHLDRVAEGKALIEEVVNRLIRLRQSIAARSEDTNSSSHVRETSEDLWFSLFELDTPY